MNDFSTRKQPVISIDPEAKSKKLKGTVEKLSTAKAENKSDITKAETSLHSISAKKQAAFSIRSGSALKTLRVTSTEDAKKDEPATPIMSAPKREPEPKRAPELDEMFEGDADNEPVLMLSPNNAVPMRRSAKFKMTTFFGVVLTCVWVGLSAYYVHTNMGWGELLSQQPHILGGFFAGILAPLALIWMILAYVQRGSDIHMYADALRAELQAMIFPSESRSQVIHEDIEALCQQAAELSASSKTVLSSIHRARVGLRNEIRDFSGLSKKTEFHIDRLADGLNERSTKLLELTDEIERRTTGLDAKTLSGAQAWDDAAQSILGKASDIESALKKGAEQILTAADKADKTTDSISDKLQGSFDVLTSSVNNVKSMTGSTVKAIMDAGKIIEDNRQSLGGGAALLAEKATEITDRLNGTVSSIQDSVDQMASKAGNIEDRLSDRVNSLSGLLNGMDGKIDEIETMGTETANKLSEAMVSAVSGADNISSSVRRAIESLTKATTDAKAQAQDVMSDVSEKVSGLNKAGSDTAENIQNILGLMEKSREQIEQTINMADTQVEKLSAAVNSQSAQIKEAQETLNERVNATQLTMAAPLEAMSRAVDNVSEKHARIEEALGNRIAELNTASDKALENTQIIRDGLRAQAQEISTLVGQIAGHSRSVGSLMTAQKDEISEQVSDTLKKIESVGKGLQSQSDKLSHMAQQAEQNITQLQGHIHKQCDDVSNNTSSVINELHELDETLDQKIISLVSRSGEATKSVQGVTESLEKSAEVIEPVYSKAVEQVNEAKDRFEKMSASFEDGTASNLDKLKSMGIMFDERLQMLTASASDASRILDASSENLSARVEDIESATKTAGEKIQDIESSFKNQASDIHLTTDQALLKINNIQKALNNQFHDLSGSVGQSVAQIEDATEQFSKQVGQIKLTSNEAIEGFDSAGEKAKEQTRHLNQIAKATSEQMSKMIRNIQGESRQLLDSSAQVLIDLKKASDGLSMRAQEVNEQMKVSLQTTKSYGNELDKQADKVAESSHKTADRISEAVAILAGKMLDVDKAANDVNAKVEVSREKLSDETDRLADVSVKAARVVEEAASSYVRQSNSLFKATQDASAHADKIRQADWRVQRESFLGSARFVLESLHSLSVDLTRMIDGEVQEKTWKSYQKGDISAFTHRLVEKKEELPLAKMRDKYGADNEFRTYINRFIRQFEEVYEQAHSNDHGELLSVTFASSDIGKLYEILCDIANRQSLIKKLALRAA